MWNLIQSKFKIAFKIKFEIIFERGFRLGFEPDVNLETVNSVHCLCPIVVVGPRLLVNNSGNEPSKVAPSTASAGPLE